MEDTTKLRASFRGQFKRLSKFSIVHTGAQVHERFARRPFEMPSRQCFKAAADSSTAGAIRALRFVSQRLCGTQEKRRTPCSASHRIVISTSQLQSLSRRYVLRSCDIHHACA